MARSREHDGCDLQMAEPERCDAVHGDCTQVESATRWTFVTCCETGVNAVMHVSCRHR